MKTVALIVILALQSSGIWPHLSHDTRSDLTSAGSSYHQPTGANARRTFVAGPLPVQFGQQPLDLPATSAIAIDTATSTVLYSKDATSHRPIASVTKIITALVILAGHNPADSMTIPQLPDYDPAAETVGLRTGEVYSTGDLVKAALINSGNDAADALAIADAGSIAAFATKMNTFMTKWGIDDTHFSNPSGLQDTDNYASAAALARIAQLALVNPFIRDVIGQTNAAVTSQSGRTLQLVTTNQLLASGNFYGIKTGYTPAAGECFVGLTRVAGHEVITVVLNAGDRFGNTRDLTNWIGHNWQWL